jgi:DNA-binding MarR family transcriptional regulator
MTKGEASEDVPAPGSAALRKAEYEALAEFRHTLRRFLDFSETAARRVGLSPRQHQALLQIRGFPGADRVGVGELAQRLRIRPHSAAELIDRLVVADLVRREADPADGRRVLVALEPKAEDLLDRLTAAHRLEHHRFGPTLAALLRQIGAGPGAGEV